MSQIRHIRSIVRSRATIEGAGVHLQRAIGFGRPEIYDPFLLLDDFRSDQPEQYLNGFPWHPHRGMETITYVLKGEVEHGDSLGNRGLISRGDVQWMTAGSGIIHQEMPRGDASGVLQGFQLWANLPAADKMMSPHYQGITSGDIPELKDEGGAIIKIIAGSMGGVKGPVHGIASEPEYLDVSVPQGKTFTHHTPRGRTVFAYVIEGKGVFGDPDMAFADEAEGEKYFGSDRDRLIGDAHLVLFGDGDSVSVSAETEPVRFLLISGKPIREPIAWRGPIVMNTEEELRIAFQELEEGTFIKHQGVLR
jgi:quercetin 2,3-dioxygenase